MKQNPYTLTGFFELEKKQLLERLAEIESTPAFSELKERLGGVVKYGWWPILTRNMISKTHELLNTGLADIMLGAWTKHAEILKYGNPGQYKPEETFLVPLAEHTITSTHKPCLEILVNGQKMAQVDFIIIVILNMNGVVLKIQDGKIMEIETGSCQGKGVLKLEDLTILEKQSAQVQLPGVIPLGDGIALALPSVSPA